MDELRATCSQQTQGYACLCYDEIEKAMFSSSTLEAETLCWVLQSKGKKKRHKKKGRANKSEGQSSHQQQQQDDVDSAEDCCGDQRKQLLARARVVGRPIENEVSGDDNATENSCNQNNPNNHSTHQHEKNDNNTTKKRSPFQDRIMVRYPSGSTYHVKRENLLPVLTEQQSKRVVVVIPETNIYRRWALIHTLPTDSFCEIGCDVGLLVTRITSHSSNPQHVSGIDKAPEQIDDAQKRFPDCRFLQWDVPLLEEPEDKNNNNDTVSNNNIIISSNDNQSSQSTRLPMDLFPHPSPCDDADENSKDINMNLVVAIDINGNRELEAVQKCLQIVIEDWKPRLILVKARSLYTSLKSPPESEQPDAANRHKRVRPPQHQPH